MNANPQWFNNVIDIVLGLLLLIMLLLLILLVVLGYYNFAQNNTRVADTLARIAEPALAGEGASPQGTSSLRADLHALSRSAFDANTLTYLFEIFTIALISGGLYLLNRSHQESREMKRRSKQAREQIASISPFLGATQLSVYLNNSFSFAYLLSTLCLQEQENIDIITKLRDTLTDTNRKLADYLQQSASIKENTLPAIYLDYMGYIKANLGKIPEQDSAIILEANQIESQLNMAFKTRPWMSPI